MTDSGEERPNGKEINVLIVDNSPSIRDVVQPVLEEEQEIRIQGEAENGMQAIEMTDQLKPDVILLADDIPDLTSEEAARRIKQRYPNTRVIIVTAEEAWRDEILRKEAAREGSAGYVTRRENVGRVLSAIKDELLTLKPKAGPELVTKTRSIWSLGKFWQVVGTLSVLSLLAAFIAYPDVLLPMAALTCGCIFFSYGVKYYLSVAFVLLATRNGNGNGNGYSNGNGNGRGLNGLASNGANGSLARQPFVSIHLPLYNEKNVVDRLMSAATSLDYKNYEVIVADDSTDETTDILNKRWGAHPRVKISHRENREGFKGAALQVALEKTDPRAEFIVVLDADFVPPPDILKQFLSHFFDLNGHGDHKKEMRLLDERVAVVQGYQWHVLNANENWITSGIRSEFSGSYVVERSSQEITGGMKMVAGSVFMIRTDVLRKIGWNTSITEDWQLTIRLYLEGYKVLYSPFIQAPAECVSTFKQLTRQRMRWAEGHTFNVKKYFWPMVLSPRVSLREKLEFFYFAPYYLQSAFFLFGTMAWLLSDVVLKFTLPYWSEVLGWSLVIVNSISLPLMNLAGLFLERGASKSWRGILSFWLLSYLLAPYQAYAALKGLLEPKEGGWHRTHKTGVITEAIDKLALKKHLKGLTSRMKKRRGNLGGRLGGTPAKIISQVPSLLLGVPRRPSLGFRLSTGMAICLVLMWIVSSQLPIASAAANVLFLRDTTTNGATPAGEDMNEVLGSSENTKLFDDASDEAYWYTEDTFPEGGDDSTIVAGNYTLQMFFDQLPLALAPVIDATSSDTTAVSSITISHTTAGSNRLMLVGVSISNFYSETVSSITYNGVALTSVGSVEQSNNARVEIWRLIAPATGTHDVVVTFSAEVWKAAVVGVMTFTGVDQTTPLGTFASNNGDSAGPANVNVSSATDELVFDTVACKSCTSLTVGGGQTERWNLAQGAYTSMGAGSTEPGAASVTMSWTLGISGDWAIGAVPILPSTPSVAPVVDATSSDTSGVSSMTISHTTSGSQRLMLVGVSMHNDLYETVTSVTYNGDPLALVGSEANADDARVEIWRLIAPDTGTYDVVITFSAELWTAAVAGVMTFTGVDQTTPLGTFVSATGLLSSPATVDVTSAANELVFDTVACQRCDSLTAGSGQTQRWNLIVHGEEPIGGASTEPGAGTVTMSWALESPNDWAIGAVPIKPPTASVDITVSLHHTDANGSDATLIISNSTTIDSDTANPYNFPLGSGAEQTFVSTDVQRLRVHIDVASVSNGGSFTLAYDSVASASNLATPDFVVPGASLLLALMVIFIPIFMNLVMRKQRLVSQVGMIAISTIGIIVVLASTVSPVSGAADVLYLRDTTTNGATPAGEDMNESLGSSEDTTIFDSVDDEAYWYTEDTFPEGDDDASIAAGSYTLQMYFDSLPGAGTLLVDDSNYDTTIGGSSITIAHTTSGTNRLMIVGVSINPENNEFVTGITWNATETLTKVRHDVDDNEARTEIWYLTNPTATSANVVVSFNTSLAQSAIAGVVTFTGVDQDTPLGDDNGDNWILQQYPSISVATDEGDMVFGVVSVEFKNITATDADTEHWRVNDLGGECTGGGGTKAGAASSTSIGWTFDNPDQTAISAVAIKPAGGVDIVVSAYHTNSSGGDATEITTSSTVTITNSTPNPYNLDIGSGAVQTFTQADPRRLRVHVDVTAVSGGGSFTLAYDSASSSSNLATPDFVVPGASVLMALVVIFIPIFMNLVMRRQGLGSHIGMNAVSVIVVIAIVAGSVVPVEAAAGVFYLRDTDTQSGTVDVKVTSSTDDAEESSVIGGMDLDSTDLELADDTSPHTVGMRFLNITVPQGAKITNATIQFTCDEAGRDMDPVDLNIQGELSPNPGTFLVDAYNITIGRPQTSAAVNWVPPTWVSDGDRLAAQRTPDMKTIIQEIVDQDGWSSGNAMVIIIDGTGRREAESWDGSDPALAPELHIEWTAADPSGKYMNDTTGSGGSTMLFDGTDDEAYWYSELKYPTGDGDATIAAGDYYLNMYFSELPGSVGAPAAAAIFYSVGTLASAMYSGNASASSGTLTLASAADNKIGVGDEIRHGLNRYYITRRLSPTRFTIQNSGANGGTPGDIDINFGTTAITIYRAFNSLSAAQTGSSNADHLGTTNLVGNYQLNWACYNDGALDDMLDLSGWTTGASNYIRIFTPVAPDQVGTSQRHTGVAGTGFRLTPVDATQQGYNIIHLKTEYVRIEGIEIDGSGLTNAEAARGITVMQDLSNVGDIRIDSTIIHDLDTSAGNYQWETSMGIHDIQQASNTGPPLLITNNIIFNIFNTIDVGHAGGMHIGSRTTSYVYNNTVYNVVNDSGTDGGPAWGIYAKAWPLGTGNATVIATNNYVGNVLAPHDPVGRCYDTRDNGILTQSYNVSSDSTASGTGSQTLKTDYATYFTSIAGGSENLHITNTSANLWGSSGNDLSATFTQDVDNTSRNAPWDISADEYGGLTASVGIAVSVYDTNSNGGDPQLITSTTTSITSSTANLLTLDLGSGVEQTYSSSDRRRLRVHIDVTSVTAGGSFTLGYDSSSDPSNLVTPDLVVPDQTFVMFSVAILIPILTGLVARKGVLGNRQFLGRRNRPQCNKGERITRIH